MGRRLKRSAGRNPASVGGLHVTLKVWRFRDFIMLCVYKKNETCMIKRQGASILGWH